MERLTSKRHAMWLAGLVLAFALALLAPGRQALADVRDDVPSVLVIDSCLGDYDLCTLHWVGEEPEVVAEGDHTMLVTSTDPAWWSEGGGTGDAPATFVLGTSAAGASVSADDIVWALDQIRASGAEPRTFVVAMGLTGLPLRQYAEGLAGTSQTSRADLVGMAFCGTPHGGCSALATYGDLPLWDQVLSTVGITRDDLTPGSAYLQELDGGTFPAVCKTLLVGGEVGDLGFGMTDDLFVAADLALDPAVSDQVQRVQVNATASQQVNLTGAWSRFTSEIDYPDRAVDGALVERLSAIAGYGISAEVQQQVREFYEAWFGEGTPVTHNSTALLFDLSGSMLNPIDASRDKLAAGKEAAKEYLRAMQAVSELPQSAPMDVSVIGFAEAASTVATGYDRPACDAVQAMDAYGETDIGLALDRAMAYLDKAPTCADRHVLLLSDGASTQGQTEEQMLSGSVAQAKAAGIAIDTIGFGDIGESDAGFLKRVSEATGGTYYLAQDTYALKVNFLTSYYSSLGLHLTDEEVSGGAPATVSVGSVDEHVTALEAGVVSERGVPQVRLLRDGEPLDEGLYSVQEEYGLVTVQVVGPKKGEYELELSGDTGSLHVFAVRQPGIAKVWHGTEAKQDMGLYLVIGAGVALVAAIGIVVARTMRKGSANASGTKAIGGTRR